LKFVRYAFLESYRNNTLPFLKSIERFVQVLKAFTVTHVWPSRRSLVSTLIAKSAAIVSLVRIQPFLSRPDRNGFRTGMKGKGRGLRDPVLPCADSHQTYIRYLLTFITKKYIVAPLTIQSNRFGV
jgi:hypothetical protein